MMFHEEINRRTFLKQSLMASGFTLALFVSPKGLTILHASEIKSKGFSPSAWFEISKDNKVRFFIAASEMGQGTHTSLAMILADELEADWRQLEILQGGAREEFLNPILHSQLTVASASIRGYYEPLRKLGASGRAMLVKAAADTWGVPEKECQAKEGKVTHTATDKASTYGELCEKAAGLQVPKDPPLKRDEEFRYIGKKIPRHDIPLKVNGKAIFGIDVRMPGMEYAVLSRPPYYGSKLASVDKDKAQAVKGVKQILEIPQGVAVVADTIEAALEARSRLQVKWTEPAIPSLDNAFIEKALFADLEKPGAEAVKKGDAEKALGGLKKVVNADYFVPFVAHTNMEPMNCTVHVQKDRCDIWFSSQAQTVPQMIASQITGMPPKDIHVHTQYVGTGLGRRARPDYVIEALVIGKHTGRPVKLIWTREEDIKYDAFRGAMAHRIKAGLDEKGHVVAWYHKAASGSILKDIDPKGIVNGVDFMSLWGLADFPNSPHGNHMLYEIPNLMIRLQLSELPIPVCPWRSVQNGPNAFVIESFIDELAFAAQKDPLSFRLEHLSGSNRAKRVLEKVAEMSGWGKKLGKGKGLGVAQHSCFGSYVAQVAQVSADKASGSYRVEKVWAAIDCGLAVNPFNIQNQIEGAIVMGLSTVLREEVRFSKGGVESSNFEDYSPIRYSEVPDIEVAVLQTKEKMGGVGEPGVPPIAPAVANAIFNATGVRMRRLPIRPKDLKTAVVNDRQHGAIG